MFERGIAYQSDGFVNWGPVDQTVLVNEQANAERTRWRNRRFGLGTGVGTKVSKTASRRRRGFCA